MINKLFATIALCYGNRIFGGLQPKMGFVFSVLGATGILAESPDRYSGLCMIMMPQMMISVVEALKKRQLYFSFKMRDNILSALCFGMLV